MTAWAYGASDDSELASLERHGRNSVDGGLANVVILEGERGARPLAIDPAVAAWFERELLCHVRAGH